MSHLFLGDDGALDAQGSGAFLAVGLDLDGLLEGAGTPDGAVGHLDFPLLARFDGLGGVFGASAAARGRRIDDEQRLVARVGELKGAAHGTWLMTSKVASAYLSSANALSATKQTANNAIKNRFVIVIFLNDDEV